jgi:hypothetical protein
MIDFVSFFFHYKKQDAESMVNIVSFIKVCIVDQEDRVRQLITWFLNIVMEEEAFLQSIQNVMRGPILAKLVEMATNPELF